MGQRAPLARQSPLLLLPLLLLLLINICTELGVFAVEVIGRPGENVTIRQGETAILLCEIPSTAKQVAWLNRSAILFAKDLRWTQDQRISLERRSPTQYALRVREVGLRDEGPYTCSLQGPGSPHTATLYLLVQVPPVITEISEDLTIDEGSNVTAFCSATGRPEPAVSWRHLSPAAQLEEVEGEFLFLERVSRTQAGEYQCSAANDVTIADTRRLRLTVNYVPSDVEIRSNGMLLGRAGSLRCQASAVPLPWFIWSKEDHRQGAIKDMREKGECSCCFSIVRFWTWNRFALKRQNVERNSKVDADRKVHFADAGYQPPDSASVETDFPGQKLMNKSCQIVRPEHLLDTIFILSKSALAEYCRHFKPTGEEST
uniref:limbic system-associated membrane protein-like n=1 Tax=Myxine glutinosa TaxID=7769 RepID=UPI00358F803A